MAGAPGLGTDRLRGNRVAQALLEHRIAMLRTFSRHPGISR